MYTLSLNAFISGSEDGGPLKVTGLAKLVPALVLLVYSNLQFVPFGSQSDHAMYTLVLDAAIDGLFESVPGLLLTLSGLLNVVPPLVLTAKNMSESTPEGQHARSCHATNTFDPETAIL